MEIVGEKVGKSLQSGAKDIVRTLTKGKQKFDTDATDTALYKAVPKYEGGIQASGNWFMNMNIAKCVYVGTYNDNWKTY